MSRAREAVRSLAPLLALGAVWLLFAGLAGGGFASWENQRLMLMQTAVVAVAAVGATLVIISGGIDLSVGSAIALGTMVVALVLDAADGSRLQAAMSGALGEAGAEGMLAFLAVASGVGVGLLCGIAIGGLVIGRISRVAPLLLAPAIAWWGWSPLGAWGAIGIALVIPVVVLVIGERLSPVLPLSPFIVTLAAWGALRGLAKGLGGNSPIYPEGSGWIAGLMRTADAGPCSIVEPAVVITIGVALAAAGLLGYARLGRHMVAVGSSEPTARLCGVGVDRTKVVVYAIAGACAGLAGVFQFSYLSMGDPTTAGGYELKVIAAVVIGGASLSGGEGSIRGTLVGALLMTVVDNGCTRLGLDNWVQEIVTGGIIVGAVLLDRARQARRP